ncbi:MAG: type II toxin-antitoxin system Phd/YefM family antitoxin [Gemmatimonadetes bacterium]|nr:type II toxin-antitoxin system Phd/YefM family antitoxin [Gemmatimonadota bacterium]
MNRKMPRLYPSKDVRPVTEFRAHASAFLEQVRATKRAVILTQHGRSAAVLLDVEVYEELIGELAQLREATDGELAEPTSSPNPRAEPLELGPDSGRTVTP